MVAANSEFVLPVGPDLSVGAWVAIVGWVFAVGCAIGSFLNVVVYRSPRGQSIVHPGSRCPACGHAIRPWDNVPVISWLVLRGRCRDCKTPFSIRYMLVELATGLGLAGLAVIGPLLGPVSPEYTSPAASQWSRFGGHAVLFCSLLTASLIQFDRKPVPRVIFALAAATIAALFAFSPQLRIVDWTLFASLVIVILTEATSRTK